MRRIRTLSVLGLAVAFVVFLGAGACGEAPSEVTANATDGADSPVAASDGSGGHGVLANQRFTNPFHRDNPCTGEAMDGTVEWHVVIREVNAGGAAVDYHMSAQVEATGQQSGLEYHGTATYNRVVNGRLNEARTLTHHVQGGIISPGSEPNWFSTFLVHTTLNAQGELTAFKSRVVQVQCRGRS